MGKKKRWVGQFAKGGRKKRRVKRDSVWHVKQTVVDALNLERDVRDLALDHSLTVRINTVLVRQGRGETHHWMFDDNKWRVLDYWPGTGRCWSGRTGERFTVKDALAALDEAARISAGVKC